ncbi:MAG: transcriptional repressor [Microscillaceae bacterium]|nr:transcriptional repressor [Microscillaceae bacterium]
MASKNSLKILQTYKLRNTDCRAEILDIFLNKSFALSNADIEEKISKAFDRVTVYRTLRTFLTKGIIHKVLDDSGNPKYALCKDHCNQSEHHHQHVHFKCNQCGQTNCLEEVEIPAIQLPQGYLSLESNLLINGVCVNCNH